MEELLSPLSLGPQSPRSPAVQDFLAEAEDERELELRRQLDALPSPDAALQDAALLDALDALPTPDSDASAMHVSFGGDQDASSGVRSHAAPSHSTPPRWRGGAGAQSWVPVPPLSADSYAASRRPLAFASPLDARASAAPAQAGDPGDDSAEIMSAIVFEPLKPLALDADELDVSDLMMPGPPSQDNHDDDDDDDDDDVDDSHRHHHDDRDSVDGLGVDGVRAPGSPSLHLASSAARLHPDLADGEHTALDDDQQHLIPPQDRSPALVSAVRPVNLARAFATPPAIGRVDRPGNEEVKEQDVDDDIDSLVDVTETPVQREPAPPVPPSRLELIEDASFARVSSERSPAAPDSGHDVTPARATMSPSQLETPSSLAARVSVLRAMLEQRDLALHAARQRVASLSTDLQDAQGHVARLRAELDGVRQQAALRAAWARQQPDDAVRTLIDSLRTTRDQVYARDAQLAAAQAAMTALREDEATKVEALRHEAERLQAELDQTVSLYAARGRALQQMQQQLHDAEAQCERAQASEASVQRDTAALVAELRGALTATRHSAALLMRESESRRVRLADLEARDAQTQLDLETARAACQALQDELADVRNGVGSSLASLHAPARRRRDTAVAATQTPLPGASTVAATQTVPPSLVSAVTQTVRAASPGTGVRVASADATTQVEQRVPRRYSCGVQTDTRLALCDVCERGLFLVQRDACVQTVGAGVRDACVQIGLGAADVRDAAVLARPSTQEAGAQAGARVFSTDAGTQATRVVTRATAGTQAGGASHSAVLPQQRDAGVQVSMGGAAQQHATAMQRLQRSYQRVQAEHARHIAALKAELVQAHEHAEERARRQAQERDEAARIIHRLRVKLGSVQGS